MSVALVQTQHMRSSIEVQLSGGRIVRLMRKHRVTIALLAAHMNITQRRVRTVRIHGVAGRAYVRDWLEGIAGAGLRRHSSG